ncbi:unnamed protein product [Rhizoctonia solani]|uniref:DRBM domain-containing protein n=1 Tax=Rhizoctonia solani TaxID=456999 RepID=A0A8H3BUF1_9AGAM|nr:unnamed protein product [Rhizoctonia solani]
MRALVVANSHLARFTQFYKLHFQLRGNASQQLTIQASVPIHADLFEAYVGALFQEQGLEPVYEFLSQILTPSIRLAYEVVRGNYVEGAIPSPQSILVFPSTTVSGVADLPAAPLIAHPLPFTADSGFTSLLNQYFAQQRKNLDWEFSPPAGTSSAPVWEVKAVERGGILLATATAGTKKTAKNIAARKALITLAYEAVRGNYVEGAVPSAQAILVFPSTSLLGVADLPAAPLIAHPLPFTTESGCTSLLNQHFAQQRKNLDWEFLPPAGTSSAPVWEVKAVERGGPVLATATAGTKKTAKNIAARRALIALGILQDSPIPHTGTEIA